MSDQAWQDPKEIIDISPIVGEDTPVFPGDTPFTRIETSKIANGDSVDGSVIRTTLHIGAHVDAPRHYHTSGLPMHEQSLSPYLGLCQVVHAMGHLRDGLIPEEFVAGLEVKAPRILFRTDTFPAGGPWNPMFAAFDPGAIDSLADRHVILAGIDTPSVDSATSKTLDAHKRFFQRNLNNLEGVNLGEVDEGLYLLSALPLRIEWGDGSPVRAVLVPLPN